jgi:hypothetical protein
MTDTLPPLPPEVLDFDQFLNEPPEYEDMRKVREYRHEAYAHWVKVVDAIREYGKACAALPAAQPSDALLRELLEQRKEYERAGIHRSDFFFIETWARVAKRVAAPVAAQPTSGVRGPECALVCQEHKAGREACKLGACVRTAGVQEGGE